jgi:hypothetical protein
MRDLKTLRRCESARAFSTSTSSRLGKEKRRRKSRKETR